jgi:hypothetical protein
MKVFWMRQVPGGVDPNSEDFEMERDMVHWYEVSCLVKRPVLCVRRLCSITLPLFTFRVWRHSSILVMGVALEARAILTGI